MKTRTARENRPEIKMPVAGPGRPKLWEKMLSDLQPDVLKGLPIFALFTACFNGTHITVEIRGEAGKDYYVSLLGGEKTATGGYSKAKTLACNSAHDAILALGLIVDDNVADNTPEGAAIGLMTGEALADGDITAMENKSPF